MSTATSTSASSVGLSELGSSKEDNFVKEDDGWRLRIQTSIARSRKVRGGNFVQIATVDPTTLEPRCRTVVFRGFLSLDDGSDVNVMKMITDARSKKVTEVTTTSTTTGIPPQHTNTAEMVWWFSKSSEQYRIRGSLMFVGEEGIIVKDDANADDSSVNNPSSPLFIRARKEQWGNLSDAAREQFYWIEPEGPYKSQDTVPLGGRDENGKVLPPPSNFLLMLLYPRRVDYLRLGNNYRQIDELVEETEWSAKRVNP